MIYLYGILSPGNRAQAEVVLGGQTGVTGDVALSPFGEWILIHSAHDGGEILPRRKSLLTHARVLETAMQAGTVLPMRFGMTCQSVEEFKDLVDSAGAKIAAGIERVTGRVEVGVRVSVAEAEALEAAVAASPRLAARREGLVGMGPEAHFAKVEFGRTLGELVAARRKSAQQCLLERLKPFCVDHVLKAPETDFEVLRAEFFIDETKLPAFSDALDHASADLDFAGGGETSVRLVGPGPAFHFVDLALAAVDAPEVA